MISHNGSYSVFNYDSIDSQNFVFDLESASPYWVLSPDSQTYSVYRFVDTSSKIDIIGYKHAFSNLPGLEVPTIELSVFTSDNKLSSDSEWTQNANVNQQTTLLFLRNVKRYCKFVVNIDSDSDISSSSFLLLVQVDISSITSPVITEHAQNILSRFPSWTKIYGDSVAQATPEIAIPKTNAGKVINAIVGEDLDQIDVLISKIELDSFITSSSESQIAWLYAYSNIKPGFIKVTGDNFELARVSSMRELLSSRTTDLVFYYNFLTSQLFTLFKPNRLFVDSVQYECEPVQQINYFDEFGLRVGLQRLYLESNENFKKRILDVYQNPPAINIEGLKKTLRRELDIWRAFGATPDSFYLGATPEILEISDIELDEKYFSKDGIPTQDFRDFVEYLNKQYPSNYGYAKWGEAYWDPAGKRMEGYSSIPKTFDSATAEYYIENYQPGIGDLNDLKLKLEKLDYGTDDYEFTIRAHGIKRDGIEQAYEPISIVYDSYVSYYEKYIDNETATVSYDVILDLNLHGDIPNDSSYKARYNVLVKNIYDQSIGEFTTKDIFSASGFTSGESIYYDQAGTPYTNTFSPNATESYSFGEIPIYAVDNITVQFVSASNSSGATGDYAKISFLDSTPSSYASKNSTTISKTAAQIDDSPYAAKLKIASNIYNPKKTRIVNTPKIRSNRFSNVLNSSIDITQKSDIKISPQSIIKDFIIPYEATPIYVYIQNVVEDQYDIDLSASPYQGYGGVSVNKQNNLRYLVSSENNIIFQFINPNFSTPELHDYYINTTDSSTVNYNFIEVKFPYNATPDMLAITSTPGYYYPFNYRTWNSFNSEYIGSIQFTMSDDGVIRSGSTGNYDIPNNILGGFIGSYDFRRSDFGLEEYAASPDVIIHNIEVINENDDVFIYPAYQDPSLGFSSSTDLQFYDDSQSVFNEFVNSDQSTPYGLLNYYDQSIEEYISKGIEFYAARYDKDWINPSIESGYIYQDGTPFYLYADEGYSISVNQSEIILDSIARQGAPVIVKVYDDESSRTDNYLQVAFTDEATPSMYSFYNTELITAVHDNHLALGYTNVFDVSITDTYTGNVIFQNQSFESNIIETLDVNGDPQIKSGRTYKVKYRVKNTYNVDNQYYSEIDSSYRTKITLLSTPNGYYDTAVFYEKSIFDSDTVFDSISFNPLYSPMSEGYVYLSQNEYELSSVDAYISPKEILDDGKQSIAVNLFSMDVNQNPKPYIVYDITGQNVSATPSVVTTNEDGYARAYVKYIGEQVATPTEYQIYVNGFSTSATVSYYVKPLTMTYEKLSAEVTKKIINADGQETVKIYGSATPNAKVYWRKGRNLFEVFNTPYSSSELTPDQQGKAGMVTAYDNGDFSIGSFRAQNDATPGYWFVVVDTEMSSAISSTPSTIAGDIVYWYERYDVNQSNSSEPVLSASQGENAGYYHYLTDSSFKKNFETDEVYYQDRFNSSWNLPSWYPISRYTQYQMGILGSTPYMIETYENLHPDYEEE